MDFHEDWKIKHENYYFNLELKTRKSPAISLDILLVWAVNDQFGRELNVSVMTQKCSNLVQTTREHTQTHSHTREKPSQTGNH